MLKKPNKFEIKREQSYKKFMEASIKVFAELGYEKASIESIAKEAGYSKGNFYIHFNSKEECLLKLMDSRFEVYSAFFQELILTETGTSDIITKAIEMFIKLLEQDKWTQIYFDICAYSIRNPQIREKIEKHYENWIALNIAFIEKAKLLGEVPQHIETLETAKVLIAVIDGINLFNTISKYNQIPTEKINNIVQIIIEQKK